VQHNRPRDDRGGDARAGSCPDEPRSEPTESAGDERSRHDELPWRPALRALGDRTLGVEHEHASLLRSAIEWRDIVPGAQTERRGGAGPVGACLAVRIPPAASCVAITLRVMSRARHAERDGYDFFCFASTSANNFLKSSRSRRASRSLSCFMISAFL